MTVASLIACLLFAAQASAAIDFGEFGEGAGQTNTPRALASNWSTGELYVADGGNDRVDVFDSEGNFIRAFGWDVVASGPGKVPAPDEVQQVTVGANATGGTFTLAFAGSSTGPIPYDAPPATVQSALNSLSTIAGAGGSVSVSGSPSGPYTITFGGAFAEDGVPQITANPAGLIVSGGAKEVNVTTLTQGGAFEVCEPAAGDACKRGSPGSGAGQFSSLEGIAVDNDETSPSFGDVFVYSNANKRVDRFTPSGEFDRAFGWGVDTGAAEPQVCTTASTCQAGLSGLGEGQFSSMRGIGTGPGGVVYVADTKQEGAEYLKRVIKYESDGTFLEGLTLSVGLIGNVNGFAVDRETGDFYLGSDFGTGGHKYDSAGAHLFAFNPSFNITALAPDPIGEVHVADRTGIDSIRRYASGGAQTRAYGYGNVGGPLAPGLAYLEAGPDGSVCVAQGSGTASLLRCFEIPPPGPIVLPEPGRTFASSVASVKATLNATINPEGKATTYHFEYVEKATYEESEFAEATRVPAEAGEDPTVGETDFLPQLSSQFIGCADPEVEAEADECLTPATSYVFRAKASNADGEDVSPIAEFETKEAPEFLATWAERVAIADAVLGATIDPLGIPTTAVFQYVDQATYEASGFAEAQQTSEVAFGKAEGEGVSRTAQLTGLDPATTYRYRLLTTNFAGDKEGPERTFTTFPASSEPAGGCANEANRNDLSRKLPDCRAYELVSPADKEGGDIVVLKSTPDVGFPAELPQASATGEALSYASYRSFAPAESAPFTSQYLARRGGEGWANEGISPPREGASFYETVAQDSQYRLFSEDLCSGWLWTDAEPVLAPGGVPGFGNLYRRSLCGAGYEAITTAKPPTKVSNDFIPEVQGASADGSMTVFRANAVLTPDADGDESLFQLYGSEGGELRLLSVLEGGEASEEDSSAGTPTATNGSGFRHDNLTHALSDDGSRLYWSTGGPAVPGKLHLRENPFGDNPVECLEDPESPCTTEITPVPARFWLASADGDFAYFSLAGTLFEFSAQSGESAPVAGQFTGVVGASENASRIYLVSEAALAPGAEAGEENLYLYERGEAEPFTLVAGMESVLIGPPTGVYCGIALRDAFNRCARVTPDGSTLAFMSEEPLTGYDNTDASSGKADAEVFLYRAETDELRCVSCNPSGGRPEGREISTSGGNTVGIAAELPTPKSAFHDSRLLFADGSRLFFESYDPLLPHDTNGRSDLYQWEAAESAGECESKRAGLHVPSAGGCLALISTGQSSEEIEFVDASASGDDVFFKTEQSLVGADDAGLFDIYDARVGGGYPEPGPPAPPCEGEACQPAVPAPEPAPLASAAYSGPGNLAAPAPRGRCARPARRAKRLARRAKAQRRAARRAKAPAAKRKRARAAKRSAAAARRLSRNAKRCRARARAQRSNRPQRRSSR